VPQVPKGLPEPQVHPALQDNTVPPEHQELLEQVVFLVLKVPLVHQELPAPKAQAVQQDLQGQREDKELLVQQEHLVFREQLERVVLRGRMDKLEPQAQREPQAKAYQPEESLDKS
jgi:hypothetical protein